MSIKINGMRYNCEITPFEDYYIISIVGTYSDYSYKYIETLLYNNIVYCFNTHLYEHKWYIVDNLVRDLNTIDKEDFIEHKETCEIRRIAFLSSSKEEYISPNRGINIKRALR